MKKLYIKNKIGSFFRDFSFVIVFFLILSTFLYYLVDNINSQNESANVVLGVVLGITLGFFANIGQEQLNSYFKRNKLKKTSLKLLEEDAKMIYRNMQMYCNASKNPNRPKIFDKLLPPVFHMKYWNKLNESNDFLLFGTDPVFSAIFDKMWSFEQINEDIFLGKEGNQAAGDLGYVKYRFKLEKKEHIHLLKLFMSQKKLNKFIKEEGISN